MLRKFAMLVMVVSMMLGLVAPVLAQEGFDFAPVIEAWMPTLPAGFGGVNASDLALEMLEDAPILIDVRNPDELAENGYIEGAINVPVLELAAQADQLPADLDANIVIYCAAGTRGLVGMTTLWLMGYTNVRNLQGGFGAWADAGNAVVTDEYVAPEAAGGAGVDEALLAGLDEYLHSDALAGWGQVAAEDVALEMLETELFFLDVREASELEANGYIDGALNIPIRDVAANVDQLPTDMPIIVYCAAGWRGEIATIALQLLGYDARNLRGGFAAWVGAGYEVVGAPEPTMGIEDVIAAWMPTLPAGFGGVSAADLAIEMLEEAPILIDVRNPDELAENGYIEGAINVPVLEMAAQADQLPADLDANIVIYCARGTRGLVGMTTMWLMGYTNVRNLQGGFGAWAEAGNAVVTDEYVAGEPLGGADVDGGILTTLDEYLHSDALAGWGQVAPEDVALEMLETELFLLDVREPSELEANGYIEGAVNVPIRDVAANLDQLPEDMPIIVYCAAGWRGEIATIALQLLGYDARNLRGGFAGWLAAGYEVVGAPEAEAEAEMVEVVLPEGMALDAETLQPVVIDAVVTIALEPGFATAVEGDIAVMIEDGAFVLDVREESEYAEGFIPGAFNAPLRAVMENLQYLPGFEDPIVVYCAAGHRGAMAALALELVGYENVVNLRGGFRAWTGEVTTDAPDMMASEFPAVDADVWTTVNAYMQAIPGGYGTIGAPDLSLLLTEEPVLLVDVREAAEYEGGFIPEAINAPLRSWNELAGDLLAEIPAMDAPVVFYGSIGHRSALAMTALQMLGYENVRSFAAGVNGWVDAGFELATP